MHIDAERHFLPQLRPSRLPRFFCKYRHAHLEAYSAKARPGLPGYQAEEDM